MTLRNDNGPDRARRMVEVPEHPNPFRVLDLGGPDGGRYWRVTSGHTIDHPDARNAAVHARATGSVGCTYNGVRVARMPALPGERA